MENDKNETLYWTLLRHEDWILRIAAKSSGLCYVGFEDPSQPEGPDFVRFPVNDQIRDEEMLKPYASQFVEYFLGKRSRFTFPLDPQGTSFQRTVWEALQNIPYGQTTSYSE